MEVDTSKQILDQEVIQFTKRRTLEEDMVYDGPIIFEDGSVTLHCASYQKYTKNILLQCVSVKGKRVTDKQGPEIEVKNVNFNDVMEIHRAIGGALAHIVDDREKENARLKQTIVELETSLNPHSLFSKPLSIVQLIEKSLGQSHKFDKFKSLLSSV